MVLFNPATGHLESDAYRRGVIDATTRALYPYGVRNLFPDQGTTVWEFILDPSQVNLAGLRDSIMESLRQSDRYEPLSVEAEFEDEKLTVTATLRFPDGTVIEVSP